ncbi:MAG: inositol-3-phosphate synthase [Kangiellaceae bacterium]|nr:inositol-3-phosphate synthase [Kangiellaceae bacterium]
MTKKLGVLLVGLGSVNTTLIAGVESIKRGLTPATGSLSQLGRLESIPDHPKLTDILPLTSLDDLVFGAWDIFPDNAYHAAVSAGVLSSEMIEAVKEPLEAITPMTGVYDNRFLPSVTGPHTKAPATRAAWSEELAKDIASFKQQHQCERLIMVIAASTEAFQPLQDCHQSLDAFEAALAEDSPSVTPLQLYSYVALKSGIPVANGTPNYTVETPALRELARQQQLPTAGSDFKTGQTLFKTVLAPAFKQRMLGVKGWFSTNILGNRDGQALHHPGSFEAKEKSKLSVLESILCPKENPELYGDIDHQIQIHYYKPRGDNKEAWDNIDLEGWMGYPMQLKINLLARDSILAAPLALDILLFLDLAYQKNASGPQDWMGLFFKSPMALENQRQVHAFSEQYQIFQSKLGEWIE